MHIQKFKNLSEELCFQTRGRFFGWRNYAEVFKQRAKFKSLHL